MGLVEQELKLEMSLMRVALTKSNVGLSYMNPLKKIKVERLYTTAYAIYQSIIKDGGKVTFLIYNSFVRSCH